MVIQAYSVSAIFNHKFRRMVHQLYAHILLSVEIQSFHSLWNKWTVIQNCSASHEITLFLVYKFSIHQWFENTQKQFERKCWKQKSLHRHHVEISFETWSNLLKVTQVLFPQNLPQFFSMCPREIPIIIMFWVYMQWPTRNP